MINKIKANKYNYFIKAMALPVLFFVSCAFTLNLKGDADTASLHRLLRRDTIPAAELSKIKPEDIVEISVTRDVAIFKLKSGDTVIARREDFLNLAAKQKKNMPSQFDSLVFEIFKMPVRDIPQVPTNTIFTKLEVEASYPGGPGGWMRYLNKNFKYPEEAQAKEIQGTVVLQFIVDSEGNVSNIEAISGPTGGGLREEGVRIIKNSGKWIPGKQNGIDVKSYKKQNITFVLERQ